jgi:uncharacterized membrane protein (DUF4010 family)
LTIGGPSCDARCVKVETALLVELAYAVGVGALVGLERSLGVLLDDPEPSENATDPPPAPASKLDLGEQLGARTFVVLSLLGYVGALLGDVSLALAVAAWALGGALVIAMYFRAQAGLGVTTEGAAIATAGLGALCHHRPAMAGVLALVLTVVLSSKRFTHATIRKMRRIELTDTLKFLAIVLIVLPLLPDRALDPYRVLNPYKIGVLVVLISGISFAGYFLTRILGARRGLGLTGLVGGLTSSTAVTAAMAAQARERPEFASACVFATVIANATMFGRVLFVVTLLDRPLALRLAWSIGAMAVTALIAIAVLYWRSRGQTAEREPQELPLKNPFSLGPALKFAAFFVGILWLLRLSQAYLGDQGLFAAAALSGLADVDAITLSLSEKVRDALVERRVAAIAITIAVVSNSLTKTGLAFYSGGAAYGRLVGACLGTATVAGLVAAFVAP